VLIAASVLNFAGHLTNQHSAYIRLDEDARAQLKTIPFCQAAARFGVPPEVAAGVFLAEKALNRGPVDSIQDTIFQILVDSRDDGWWASWASDAMKLAGDAENVRMNSNKWPPRVISTGLVFSLGPAQITPRTALRACTHLQNTPAPCKEGTRSLIRQLLTDPGAAEIVALVLRFEQEAHEAHAGVDLAKDVGIWATVYNFGGDYYRRAFKDRSPINLFGRWVTSNLEEIRRLLNCSAKGDL
jgi:hypothetical protein